ncbi:MAG TPA: anthranilate phosphoribosyltransferase [Pyrinomonadaceae bacterium]|jgi:anthranilate phosphoribosyltransferase|nr:anthranilate phosphoribosyltransferase [Pyrinomonadaceae bacterium]
MKSMLSDQLDKFRGGDDVLTEDATAFFDALITETDETLLLDIFEAWNRKGTTEDEIFALATIMRQRCRKIESKHERFVDVVGTGGSRAKTFNVSTAAAFVVAGAGIPVAKHGNRAASSNSGSADVLTELDIDAADDPATAEKCLNEVGICFMFAPNHHSLSPTLAKVRRQLGAPTIFNNLGPLCNPANAPIQLIGVWDQSLVEKTAKVLERLGTKCSWIVNGCDGLDELTLSGETNIAEVGEDYLNRFTVEPEDFGVERRNIGHLRVATAGESAAFINSILERNCTDQAAIDLVLINASVPIFLADIADTYLDAYLIAKQSLESGAALDKLNELRSAMSKTA